jgi:hypothetical protein
LTPKKAETKAEKEAEEVINMVSRSMKTIADRQPPRITEIEQVEEVVKKLDPRKARDKSTWKNDMIIEGGKEMAVSIKKIINEVDRQNLIPDQWESIEIKSIHKKGEKKQMSNKRGLFLTNNISKVYERVVKNRNSEEFRNGISEWSTGGITNRSSVDNVMVTTAIIEQNRYMRRETYMAVTDAEKCFDKLWLEDGVYELWRCGTDVRDCEMIRKLNEKAVVVVKTPVGDTEAFTVENIVRQGSVYGPQICCASTDKVNLMGKDVIAVYSPELVIRALIFVDDITAVGGPSAANNVIYNCGLLEEKKKMKFNKKNGKTEYMAIGKLEKEKKMVTSRIKDGRIERVKEHNLLGSWFDETGNYGINIVKRSEKLPFMIATIKNQGHPKNIGIYAVETRLTLAQIVVVPSLLHHVEGYPNFSEKEIEKLESMQLEILTGILEIPRTTSYYALLLETGWWTMRARVDYKKLMLLHNIVQSDERRFIKRLIVEQEKENRESTWYGSVKRIKAKYDIQLDEKVTLKSTWKRHVKQKIAEKEEVIIRDRCKQGTKARTIARDLYECKRYMRGLSLADVKRIIRYRLHMSQLPANYKQNGISRCPLCEEGEGNTEHYFRCGYTKYLAQTWRVSEEDLESQDEGTMKNLGHFYEKVEEMIQPILYPKQ